jgi:hypothetical protein
MHPAPKENRAAVRPDFPRIEKKRRLPTADRTATKAVRFFIKSYSPRIGFSGGEAANLKVCRSLRDFPGQIKDLSGEPVLGELFFSKKSSPSVSPAPIPRVHLGLIVV